MTKTKTDFTTLYELEVFAKIRETLEYKDRKFRGTYIPPLIGPDRATLQHSKNTIESFDGEAIVRPDYRSYVDILGFQAKGHDISATEENANDLVMNFLGESVWCTACDQEWYRNAPADEALPDESAERLRAEKVDDGFWTFYEQNTPLMTPAS